VGSIDEKPGCNTARPFDAHGRARALATLRMEVVNAGTTYPNHSRIRDSRAHGVAPGDEAVIDTHRHDGVDRLEVVSRVRVVPFGTGTDLVRQRA